MPRMKKHRLLTLASVLILLTAPHLLAHLDPSGWRVVDVSSQNVITGELAHFAIDGDPETQWHTRWHDTRETEPVKPPHSITIDFRAVHSVAAIRYRARAHGEGGLPREYSLELSLEGRQWKKAANGLFTFRSSMSPHAVIELETPVEARFLRLTVLSLQPSERPPEPGLVMSEIDVATPDSPLTPTTLLPVPQSREWNYDGYNWVKRHRDLLAYSEEHPSQLVFIGDSINHRWGAPPFDETPRTGQSVWEHYYGHRNALCLGYGWDRVENMLWRLQHGELSDTNPRLVVLMAGTNNFEVNSPEEIVAGVAAICDEIHRQKPTATVLLLAIFPRGASGTFPELQEANQRLSQLGERKYIIFKDIGPAFLSEQGALTKEVMPDLLHPNAEGYRRWARAIEEDVARILGDSPVGE